MQQKGMHTTGSVVVDVVEAVANATGTDPLSLEPQLNEVIDPEALERLVTSDGLRRVTFVYEGLTVVVKDNGAVTVDEGGVQY